MGERIRQKSSHLKQIVAHANEGDSVGAVRSLINSNSVFELKSKTERINHVSKEIVQDRLALKSSFILSQTNRERKAINDQVRDNLKKENLLSAGEVHTVFSNTGEDIAKTQGDIVKSMKQTGIDLATSMGESLVQGRADWQDYATYVIQAIDIVTYPFYHALIYGININNANVSEMIWKINCNIINSSIQEFNWDYGGLSIFHFDEEPIDDAPTHNILFFNSENSQIGG